MIIPSVNAGAQSDGVTTIVDDATATVNSIRSLKKTGIKRPVDVSNRQVVQARSTRSVRFPTLTHGDSGPHHVPGCNAPALNTLKAFELQRGMTSHDYAKRCLAVAQRFTARPWLQQVRHAVTIATIGVRRAYRQQPHLFATDNSVT